MKPLFLILISLLPFSLPVHSQPGSHLDATSALPATAPGSEFYVRLKDGQTRYSSFVHLKHSNPAEKYLALDNNRHIPIGQVDRYRTPYGTYLTVPDSTGTNIYRIQQEGRRLSLYSRLAEKISDMDNHTSTRSLFFRKTGETTMTPAAMTCLQQAMADNPASLHQLQKATRLKHIGLGIVVASAIVEGLGVYQSTRKKIDPIHLQPDSPLPPPHLLPKPYYTVSPLLFIGGEGLLAGFVVLLNAHHHVKKALDIYNQ